jgi:hypothetical protein
LKSYYSCYLLRMRKKILYTNMILTGEDNERPISPLRFARNGKFSV